MFGPPNIFIGGGGDCSPAPPGSTPLGASDLDEQGGMCTVADPGFAKKGVGGKIRARKRAPHTGGVQGPAVGPLAGCRGKAPAGGPGGGAPGSSRVFSK